MFQIVNTAVEIKQSLLEGAWDKLVIYVVVLFFYLEVAASRRVLLLKSKSLLKDHQKPSQMKLDYLDTDTHGVSMN